MNNRSEKLVTALHNTMYKTFDEDNDYELNNEELTVLEKGDLGEAEFKTVVRRGKKVKILICKKGWKRKGGTCVKMTPVEQKRRGIAARAAGKKRKGKKVPTAILRKRAASVAKK